MILSQITSKNSYDSYSIKLLDTDFDEGKLIKVSNIRTNKIFTADENIILYKAAHLRKEKIKEVTDKVIEIFTKY